ncbi:MAG: DUF4331 domain-containing protein [Methylococcaceae bacterium]|nr:DUF4331 domain-containing protein [Methylococcaceae bacterium]
MKNITQISTALGLSLTLVSGVYAANHREAPITALDHKADITDVYAFVSYDNPDKVTLIMNIDPLLEPSNGPTRFPFDPEIRYSIKIDNNHDAIEDISFDFQFKTNFRLPGVFVGLVGAGDGLVAPENSPWPVLPGTPLVPPAITALAGPGSEGLNLNQQYTVTLVKYRKGRAKHREKLSEDLKLFAVPSNAGPRTMPNYAELTDQGIYQLEDGIKVFAGTVDDPFYIDLGAVFDSFNLRTDAFATGIPGVLSDSQDANDQQNFAADDIAGFNVNSIAIEVPIALITQDKEKHDATDAEATIGIWATTSRPRVKVSSKKPGREAYTSKRMVQIQRMANPLINELLIGIGSKDKFSMSKPKNDKQFASFVLDPVLARVLNALYDTISPGVLPVPNPPRTDLLPLVQYLPPIAAAGTATGPVADLLRLNTGVSPTVKAQRSRLGLLTGDPAGFPNGRRVSDDVVDITTRVVLGVLAGDGFNGFPHNRVGDGVNKNDVPYRETFPYLGLAHSGVKSRHIDTGEPGCTGNCP